MLDPPLANAILKNWRCRQWRPPTQGDREPWVNTQDYKADRKLLGEAPVDDGVMTFA